jgi:excisionase family DNA binding protein
MKRRNRGRPAESEPGGLGSEILTLYQVTRYLNCHRSTVYRLIQQRELPAFRLGSDWRFRRADLDKWIAQQHVQTAPIEPSRTARYRRKS